jgi:hypothetical protein
VGGISDFVRKALSFADRRPLLAPAGFASLVVADFPALFAAFGWKRFTPLWRGSRDGFGADDFHGRCDGHAPTLTLIEDTEGNIFGGFTPVEWESCSFCEVDPSLKSFRFTLKNQHNLPARKFALTPPAKDWAIYCNLYWGPCFSGIWISNNCNANTGSCTSLGRSSATPPWTRRLASRVLRIAQ